MKKNNVFKLISIVLALVSVFALICAVTVAGSGFLDLSNIAKTVFICIAIICGVLSTAVWKFSKPKG